MYTIKGPIANIILEELIKVVGKENASFIVTACNEYAANKAEIARLKKGFYDAPKNNELIKLLKRVQALDETKIGHDLLADIDEAIVKTTIQPC